MRPFNDLRIEQAAAPNNLISDFQQKLYTESEADNEHVSPKNTSDEEEDENQEIDLEEAYSISEITFRPNKLTEHSCYWEHNENKNKNRTNHLKKYLLAANGQKRSPADPSLVLSQEDSNMSFKLSDVFEQEENTTPGFDYDLQMQLNSGQIIEENECDEISRFSFRSEKFTKVCETSHGITQAFMEFI